MKKLLVLLLPILIWAQQDISIDNIVRVYDGDTLFVDIHDCNIELMCKNMGVRVKHIDTPEMKSKSEIEKEKAHEAKAFAINFLSDKDNIRLTNCTKDKFFRLNCDVVNIKTNKKLSDELIENKLGVKYEGDLKVTDWDTF